MADLSGVKASGGHALSAIAYAGAAVAAVIAVNYLPTTLVGPTSSIGNWGTLAAGIAVFALPTFVVKENTGFMGPVRMFLAVSGLVLVLEAIIGNGAGSNGLISVALPPQIGSVV